MSAPATSVRVTVEDLALLAMAMTFMLGAFGHLDRARYAEMLLANLSGLDVEGWTDIRSRSLDLDARIGAVLMEHMSAPTGSS